MKHITGNAITDDNWTVTCPECGREIETDGYFESSDIETCDCGAEFMVDQIIFENGDSII